METQDKIRIVAAVLDTKNLVLYKPDGQTILIPQGDSRIRPILDQATPGILANGYFDLDMPSAGRESAFGTFEKKGGIARFFKVAKTALTKFFGSEEATIEPVSVGILPNQEKEAKEEKLKSAVAEVLANAVPVTSPEFTEQGILPQRPITNDDGVTPARDDLEEEKNYSHTVVAVVDNKIVPGVEKVKSQIARAASNNTKGMDAFLSRCASVTHKRKHSVEDLLRFLERGDLPIAEDGSILIYKVLRRSKANGSYVDCYTGSVTQKVGSYVCMDESLVDQNRRNECSNGLHVARRGYVGGFSGDVCVMAKLAPEDVIAVPEYDANKMRVCGYHIIFELTPQMFDQLKANKPITDLEEGRIMLAKALAGEHTGIIEEVRITGQMGQGVVITPKDGSNRPTAPSKVIVEGATALTNEEAVVVAPPVNPKEVIKEVATLSRKDQAKSLFEKFLDAKGTVDEPEALAALTTFKKQCKVGWDKLGIPDPMGIPVTKAKSMKAQTKDKATATAQVKPKDNKKMMTPREEIQHLLPKFDAASGNEKAEFARDILKLKQQAKKSWDVLGVPKATVEKILLRAK